MAQNSLLNLPRSSLTGPKRVASNSLHRAHSVARILLFAKRSVSQNVSNSQKKGQTRPISQPRAARDSSYTSTNYGGGGKGGENPREYGRGGGDDSNNAGSSDDLTSLLIAAGKSAEALPEDLLAALKSGRLPKDILERYLQLENSFLSPFLNIGGFRERLLADPSFFVKLSIELGIGIAAKGTAELNKRGDNFSQELDFVLANVMMALIADFCLVWLPAPTFSTREKRIGSNILTNNPITRYFDQCPDNAFQKVPSGYERFTFAQRLGAPLRNGSKLLLVGFGASMFGVGVTNALVAVRQMLDPNFHPQNPPQDVIKMSLAYASYMAISSNLRYQVIAGVIEERGIEAFLHGSPRICNILSFLVRTSNTYLGSLLWVDYIRLLGLQKVPGVSE